MKKIYFTVNTMALCEFLKDSESFGGINKIDYELIRPEEPSSEDLDVRLWAIEMEVETPFNIGILITLAFMTDQSFTRRRSLYQKFRENLLRSTCHKYSISPMETALEEGIVAEVII